MSLKIMSDLLPPLWHFLTTAPATSATTPTTTHFPAVDPECTLITSTCLGMYEASFRDARVLYRLF